MFKLIVFIILFRLLWILIIAPIIKSRLFIVNNRARNGSKYKQQKFYRNHGNHQHNNKQHNTQLTKCNLCNLYLPIEDAVYNNGKSFCCTEHAKYPV